MPMRHTSPTDVEMIEIGAEPEVALDITARSGPIVIEIDYQVDPAEARKFYEVMLKLQRARLRNGAYQWSLARDLADPALWTERYHLPTWLDYLRLRSRFTHADRALQAAADAFNGAPRSRDAFAGAWSVRSARCAGARRLPTPTSEPMTLYPP